MARFPIRPGRGLGTSAHPSRTAPEHALSTFIRGAILNSDGSGNLQEPGADPVEIMGISEEAGKNNAVAGAGQVRYTPVTPSMTFECSLDKASGLGYLSLATDLHKSYGLTKDSGGIWYVDVDKTAGDARVRIVQFKDPVGTASARVFVVFLMGTTAYN